MSGYPYGNPQQYPPPQGQQIYPQIYNPVNAGAPPPGQAGFPPQYQPQYQPSFGYPYQPGQPGQPGPPGQQPPSAMSYPSAPSAPGGFGYAPAPGYPNVSPTPAYGSAVEWVATTPNDAHMLSDRAVVGGYEGYDGSPIWVIRARFEGDLIPGKLALKHKAAYVPWGGDENAVRSIEVLCARPERIRWVECREASFPPNAVPGGNTANGEPLYIGRAKEQGSLTPGKVHPSHQVLYISFSGKEIPHKVYEILCTV